MNPDTNPATPDPLTIYGHRNGPNEPRYANGINPVKMRSEGRVVGQEPEISSGAWRTTPNSKVIISTDVGGTMKGYHSHITLDRSELISMLASLEARDEEREIRREREDRKAAEDARLAELRAS